MKQQLVKMQWCSISEKKIGTSNWSALSSLRIFMLIFSCLPRVFHFLQVVSNYSKVRFIKLCVKLLSD